MRSSEEKFHNGYFTMQRKSEYVTLKGEGKQVALPWAVFKIGWESMKLYINLNTWLYQNIKSDHFRSLSPFQCNDDSARCYQKEVIYLLLFDINRVLFTSPSGLESAMLIQVILPSAPQFFCAYHSMGSSTNYTTAVSSYSSVAAVSLIAPYKDRVRKAAGRVADGSRFLKRNAAKTVFLTESD